MKRTTLALILCFFCTHAFSQGMYGFEGGFGKATSGRSYTTPAFTGYILGKLTRSFYLGAALSYQRYSFDYNYKKAPSSLNYGDVVNISNKSSYLLFSPKAEFGIGYRKYIHLYATFGAGVLLGGKQLSYKFSAHQTTPSGTTTSDTTELYTSSDMPVLISRYSVGASWRIPTLHYWNVIISTEYDIIPTNLTTHGPNLKTNYFCFTVGIMHKYPMTFVEY